MRFFLLAFTLAATALPAQSIPKVGDRLPPWTPGTLDIHQISTGRGNSAFHVWPDGTTMLFDAGAAGDGIPETSPHPDATRSPGEWIARYVKRHQPPGATAIDYALITHFHVDHVGGLAAVANATPIRTLIDRGWPAYDYPAPLTDSLTAGYRRLVDEKRKTGMKVEAFRAGAADQIHARTSTSGFEVRNIVANGVVWTGTGSSSRSTFPSLATTPRIDWPNENMCSLGIRLTFGRFSYFTGGDLPGQTDPGTPSWHSLESAIADVIGHVDVHVVNQHGSMGEESEPFLRALQSSVLIVPSWAPSHPAPDVLKRVMGSRLPPDPRLVFATDMRDAAKIVIGQRANALGGPTGHIVIRVAPGGMHYWIIVTSNADESDTVLAVKGPFTTQ